MADEFRQEHEGSSVFVYETAHIFNKVLDNPKEYGFTEETASTEIGDIWCDMAHCGGAMHKIIGEDVASFLATLPQ